MDGIIDHLLAHYSAETLQKAALWIGPAAILAITLLREGWIAWRYSRSRFRAARLCITGRNAGWVTAYFFMLLIITAFAAIKVGETPPFNWVGLTLLMTWVGTALGAGILAFVLRNWRMRKIADYVPHCPECAHDMRDTTAAEQETLTPQQQCEVLAGGMMLEVWRCQVCSSESVYFRKWVEAGNCSKCGWRTLKRSTSTLEHATTSRAGRVRITLSCRNPACAYAKSWERAIRARRRTK